MENKAYFNNKDNNMRDITIYYCYCDIQIYDKISINREYKLFEVNYEL